MHNLIHYKEHYGRISYSAGDRKYTSSVKGMMADNSISVKGLSEDEVTKAFKDCIDELMNTNIPKKNIV